jgi:hypothetical protein
MYTYIFVEERILTGNMWARGVGGQHVPRMRRRIWRYTQEKKKNKHNKDRLREWITREYDKTNMV